MKKLKQKNKTIRSKQRNKSTKFIHRFKQMIGGDISKFKENYNNSQVTEEFTLIQKSTDINNNDITKPTIVEIGRGGGGIVYVDNSQPKFVFKISKKGNVCRTWNNEKNIYDELSHYDLNSVNCKLIKMLSFENNGNSCFFRIIKSFQSNK